VTPLAQRRGRVAQLARRLHISERREEGTHTSQEAATMAGWSDKIVGKAEEMKGKAERARTLATTRPLGTHAKRSCLTC